MTLTPERVTPMTLTFDPATLTRELRVGASCRTEALMRMTNAAAVAGRYDTWGSCTVQQGVEED